jgi:solute:Na+ symporter, SSS family
MSITDWLVLALTILSIIFYGVWKSRGTHNIEGYLLAERKLPWYHVGLSVMATQASAITFLSAPGQGYSDGLRFVQFYFGLPLAMVVLCITFIPIFHKLNVYTAYEYLEQRFDMKTRTLTAFLFLLQRGLSTGITIYAPALILSTLLHVDITYTTLVMGAAVILYTVYGGTKAVSYTQMFQMAVIFTGLFLAGYMVVHLLPEDVGFSDALHIAGKMGRLNAIDLKPDWNSRYNIWSGIIGGFFLQLSYFGTDQSQVGRYLTGSSVTQSRLGLVMNGLVKIPMQFLILLIGTLVFAFYQYHTPPLFFDKVEVNRVEHSPYSRDWQQLKQQYAGNHAIQRIHVDQLTNALHRKDEPAAAEAGALLKAGNARADTIRKKAMLLLKQNNPAAELNDTNYVFLSFVMDYLPVGMVGLLIAIIFLAAMGSTASGLNSLASATIIDVYRRFYRPEANEAHYLRASRIATVVWGVFCVIVGLYAGRLGNLIEAVNILGSLFYGTILGIFLVAFYLKSVKGTAVFYAALFTELLVIVVWKQEWMAFLWLNVLGCLVLMGLAWLIQRFRPPVTIPD